MGVGKSSGLFLGKTKGKKKNIKSDVGVSVTIIWMYCKGTITIGGRLLERRS